MRGGYEAVVSSCGRWSLLFFTNCLCRCRSTGAEATIDIDSLCEGVDYSSKISRARFEDLISSPLVHLKTLLSQTLASASLEATSVTHVCVAGGVSSVPRVLSTIKSILTAASFEKLRVETAEAQCVGAALQGKLLLEQVLKCRHSNSLFF